MDPDESDHLEEPFLGHLSLEDIHSVYQKVFHSTEDIRQVLAGAYQVCAMPCDSGQCCSRELLDALLEIERLRWIKEQLYWDFQLLDCDGDNALSFEDSKLLLERAQESRATDKTWLDFLRDCAPSETSVSWDVLEDDGIHAVRDDSLNNFEDARSNPVIYHWKMKHRGHLLQERWEEDRLAGLVACDGGSGKTKDDAVRAMKAVNTTDLALALQWKYEVLLEKLYAEMLEHHYGGSVWSSMSSLEKEERMAELEVLAEFAVQKGSILVLSQLPGGSVHVWDSSDESSALTAVQSLEKLQHVLQEEKSLLFDSQGSLGESTVSMQKLLQLHMQAVLAQREPTFQAAVLAVEYHWKTRFKDSSPSVLKDCQEELARCRLSKSGRPVLDWQMGHEKIPKLPRSLQTIIDWVILTQERDRARVVEILHSCSLEELPSPEEPTWSDPICLLLNHIPVCKDPMGAQPVENPIWRDPACIQPVVDSSWTGHICSDSVSRECSNTQSMLDITRSDPDCTESLEQTSKKNPVCTCTRDNSTCRNPTCIQPVEEPAVFQRAHQMDSTPALRRICLQAIAMTKCHLGPLGLSAAWEDLAVSVLLDLQLKQEAELRDVIFDLAEGREAVLSDLYVKYVTALQDEHTLINLVHHFQQPLPQDRAAPRYQATTVGEQNKIQGVNSSPLGEGHRGEISEGFIVSEDVDFQLTEVKVIPGHVVLQTPSEKSNVAEERTEENNALLTADKRSPDELEKAVLEATDTLIGGLLSLKDKVGRVLRRQSVKTSDPIDVGVNLIHEKKSADCMDSAILEQWSVTDTGQKLQNIVHHSKNSEDPNVATLGSFTRIEPVFIKHHPPTQHLEGEVKGTEETYGARSRQWDAHSQEIDKELKATEETCSSGFKGLDLPKEQVEKEVEFNKQTIRPKSEECIPIGQEMENEKEKAEIERIREWALTVWEEAEKMMDGLVTLREYVRSASRQRSALSWSSDGRNGNGQQLQEEDIADETKASLQEKGHTDSSCRSAQRGETPSEVPWEKHPHCSGSHSHVSVWDRSTHCGSQKEDTNEWQLPPPAETAITEVQELENIILDQELEWPINSVLNRDHSEAKCEEQDILPGEVTEEEIISGNIASESEEEASPAQEMDVKEEETKMTPGTDSKEQALLIHRIEEDEEEVTGRTPWTLCKKGFQLEERAKDTKEDVTEVTIGTDCSESTSQMLREELEEEVTKITFGDDHNKNSSILQNTDTERAAIEETSSTDSEEEDASAQKTENEEEMIDKTSVIESKEETSSAQEAEGENYKAVEEKKSPTQVMEGPFKDPSRMTIAGQNMQAQEMEGHITETLYNNCELNRLPAQGMKRTVKLVKDLVKPCQDLQNSLSLHGLEGEKKVVSETMADDCEEHNLSIEKTNIVNEEVTNETTEEYCEKQILSKPGNKEAIGESSRAKSKQQSYMKQREESQEEVNDEASNSACEEKELSAQRGDSGVTGDLGRSDFRESYQQLQALIIEKDPLSEQTTRQRSGERGFTEQTPVGNQRSRECNYLPLQPMERGDELVKEAARPNCEKLYSPEQGSEEKEKTIGNRGEGYDQAKLRKYSKNEVPEVVMSHVSDLWNCLGFKAEDGSTYESWKHECEEQGHLLQTVINNSESKIKGQVLAVQGFATEEVTERNTWFGGELSNSLAHRFEEEANEDSILQGCGGSYVEVQRTVEEWTPIPSMLGSRESRMTQMQGLECNEVNKNESCTNLKNQCLLTQGTEKKEDVTEESTRAKCKWLVLPGQWVMGEKEGTEDISRANCCEHDLSSQRTKKVTDSVPCSDIQEQCLPEEGEEAAVKITKPGYNGQALSEQGIEEGVIKNHTCSGCEVCEPPLQAIGVEAVTTSTQFKKTNAPEHVTGNEKELTGKTYKMALEEKSPQAERPNEWVMTEKSTLPCHKEEHAPAQGAKELADGDRVMLRCAKPDSAASTSTQQLRVVHAEWTMLSKESESQQQKLESASAKEANAAGDYGRDQRAEERKQESLKTMRAGCEETEQQSKGENAEPGETTRTGCKASALPAEGAEFIEKGGTGYKQREHPGEGENMYHLKLVQVGCEDREPQVEGEKWEPLETLKTGCNELKPLVEDENGEPMEATGAECKDSGHPAESDNETVEKVRTQYKEKGKPPAGENGNPEEMTEHEYEERALPAEGENGKTMETIRTGCGETDPPIYEWKVGHVETLGVRDREMRPPTEEEKADSLEMIQNQSEEQNKLQGKSGGQETVQIKNTGHKEVGTVEEEEAKMDWMVKARCEKNNSPAKRAQIETVKNVGALCVERESLREGVEAETTKSISTESCSSGKEKEKETLETTVYTCEKLNLSSLTAESLAAEEEMSITIETTMANQEHWGETVKETATKEAGTVQPISGRFKQRIPSELREYDCMVTTGSVQVERDTASDILKEDPEKAGKTTMAGCAEWNLTAHRSKGNNEVSRDTLLRSVLEATENLMGTLSFLKKQMTKVSTDSLQDALDKRNSARRALQGHPETVLPDTDCTEQKISPEKHGTLLVYDPEEEKIKGSSVHDCVRESPSDPPPGKSPDQRENRSNSAPEMDFACECQAKPQGWEPLHPLQFYSMEVMPSLMDSEKPVLTSPVDPINYTEAFKVSHELVPRISPTNKEIHRPESEAYTSEPDELERPEKGTCKTGTSVVGLTPTSQSSPREESTVWGCNGYDHPTHTRKDTTKECFTEPESPPNKLVNEGGSQPVHCPEEEERTDSPPSQGHFIKILGDTSWEKHPDCSGGDSHARVFDNNPESESQKRKPSGRGSDAAGQESSRELTITVLQTTVNLIGSLSSLHDRLGEVSEPANAGFRDAFEDEGCPRVTKQKPTARSSAGDGQFPVTDPEGTSLKKPENGISGAESIGDSIETTLECLALVREDCATAPKILHLSEKEGQENEEVPENTFSFKNEVAEMATDVGHKEWILPKGGTLGDKELTKESNGIDCQCQIQEFDPEEVAAHEPWILQVHAAQEEQENIESNTTLEHTEGDRLTEETEREKEENHQARRTVGENVTCLFSRSGCEELCYPGQAKDGSEQIEESTGSWSDERHLLKKLAEFEQRTFTVGDATQHETTQTTGREQKIKDFMAVCKEPNASEKKQEEEKRMIEDSTQMLSRTGEQERNQTGVSGMSLDEPEWNPTFSVVSEPNSGQCEQWEEERRLIENATDSGPAWHHILAPLREAEQGTIKIEHGGDNPPAMSKDAAQEIVREDSTENGCKGHDIPVQPKETLMEVMIKDTSKTGCERHGPQAQTSNGKQGAENTTIVECEGHNPPDRTKREAIKAMAEYIKMGECREWDQKSNVQQELSKSNSGTKWEEHDPPAPAMSVEITVSKSKGLELPEEAHDEVMENSTHGEQDTPAEVEKEIAKNITMTGAESEENEDVSRPRSEGWDSSSSETESTVKHTLSTSYKGHDSCIRENNFVYESQYPVAVEAINYTTRDDCGKLDPLPQNGMVKAEQTARNDSEVNYDLKSDNIELTEDATRTEGERHDEIPPPQEWKEVTQDATRVKFERIEPKEVVVAIENKSMDEGEVKNSSAEDWVAMTDYTLKATLSASHEARDFQIEGNYDLGRISSGPGCEFQDLLVQKGAEVIDCSSRAECKGQDTLGKDDMRLANVATGAEWEAKNPSVQDVLKASEGSRRAEQEGQDEELPVDEREYAAQDKSRAKSKWQNPLVQEKLEVNADATWVEHEGHILPARQEMKMNKDITNAEHEGQSPLDQKEVEINKDRARAECDSQGPPAREGMDVNEDCIRPEHEGQVPPAEEGEEMTKVTTRAECDRQDPPTQEGMNVNEDSTSPEHEGHVPPLLGEEEMVQDTNSGECQAHNLSAQDKVQVTESSPRGPGNTWEVSETVEMTLKGTLCARGDEWDPCVEGNECLTRGSSTLRFGSQEPLPQEGDLVMEHIRKIECERQNSLAKEENDKTQNTIRGKIEGHVPSLQQMEELPLDTTRLDLTLDTARGECEGWDPSVQESIEMTEGTTRAKCEKNNSSVQNMPEVNGDATRAEYRFKGYPAQEEDVVVEDTPRAAYEEWDSPVEETVIMAENTTMAKCEGQSNVTEGHKEMMLATTLTEYAECVEQKQVKDNTDDTRWGKCEGHYPPSKGNKRLNGDISSTEWDITCDLADVETVADVEITRAGCKDYKLPVQREIETTVDSGIGCEQRAPPVQEWEAINEDTIRAEGLHGPEDQGEKITVKGTYRAKSYGQHDLGKGNGDLVGDLNKPDCDEQGPLSKEGVDILEDANKSQHEEVHLSSQHGVAMAEDTRKDKGEGWDSVIQRRVQSTRDMIKAEFELQHPLAQARVHVTGGSSWNTCQVQQLQEFLFGEQEDDHEDIPKNGSMRQDCPAIQHETATTNSTATELGGLHPSTYHQNKKVTPEIIRAGNEGCGSSAEGEKELLQKTLGVGCQEGQNPAALELTDNTPVGRYGESNLPAELDHTEEGTTRCRHEDQTKPKKDKEEEEQLELTTEGVIEQPYGTDQEVTGQKRLNNTFSYLGPYENTIQISLVGAHETIKTGWNELNPPVDGAGEEMPRKHSEARSDEWDPSVYRIKDEKDVNGNISESKFDDQDSSSQKVVVEEEAKTQFDLQELSGDRAEVLDEVSMKVTIVRCVKEHSSIQKTEAKYERSEEAIWVYSEDRHSLKNIQIYKQVAKEINEATVVMCDEQDPPSQRKMYGFAEETCEATCTQQNQSAQRARTEWDDTEPQPQVLMGKQDVTELTAEVSKSGQERIYQPSRGVTAEEQLVEKSMRSKYKDVDFQVYGVREEEETTETIKSGQEDINQSSPRMKGEDKVSHKSVNEDICLLSKEVMREESKKLDSTEMAFEDMARPSQRVPEMDKVIREIPRGIRASIHHQGLDLPSRGMTNNEEENVEATSVGHEEKMPPTNEDEKEAPDMRFTEIVVDINCYEKKTQTHKEDQGSEKKLKDDNIKEIVMDKRKLKNETIIVGGKRNVEYGNGVQGMVQTFVNCGFVTQEVDNKCNINVEYKIAPFVELDKEEDQNKQGIIKEEIFMENAETVMEEIIAREENIVEDGVRYMKIIETDNKKVSVNQVWKEVDIRDVKEVLIKEETEDREKGFLPMKEEGAGVQENIREEVREANSGNQMVEPVVVESENGKDQDYRKVAIKEEICRAQSKKDEMGEEMAEKYQKELENNPEEGTLSTDDGNKYRDYAERSQEVERVSAEMMKKKLDLRNEKMITDKREEEQKTLSENELSIPISAYYTLPCVGDLPAEEKEKQGDSGGFTPTKLESNFALNNHPKLLICSFAASQTVAADKSQRSCAEKMKCDPADSWTIGRLVRNEAILTSTDLLNLRSRDGRLGLGHAPCQETKPVVNGEPAPVFATEEKPSWKKQQCFLHSPLQREKAFIRLSKKEHEEAMRKLNELQMRLESKHQWDKERQMLRFQERLSIAKNRKSDDDLLGAHLGDGHRHLTESLQQQDQAHQKTVVRQRIEKVKRERSYIMQSKRERNTSSFKGLLDPKVASGEHPLEERTTAGKAESM